MSNRRDFIRTGLLAAGAIGLGSKSVLAAPLIPQDAKADENYWKLVRAQFPLSHSKIFLNNGTIGPSPYSVLNEVQQEMLEIESSGRYGGYEDTAIKSLEIFGDLILINTDDSFPQANGKAILMSFTGTSMVLETTGTATFDQ